MERRLVVDIAAAGGAYEEWKIWNIGLIYSSDIIADALAKVKSNGALKRLSDTHRTKHEAKLWVL